MKKFVPYAMVFLLASGTAAVMVLVLLLVRPGIHPSRAVPLADSLRTAERGRTMIVEAAAPDRKAAQADSATTGVTPAVSPAETSAAGGWVGNTGSAVAADHEEHPPLRGRSPQYHESTLNKAAGAQVFRKVNGNPWQRSWKRWIPRARRRSSTTFRTMMSNRSFSPIKRRQAAKILAALDPDRAARIMR